ncbi:MAG: MgtC/SapB family protein [Brevundimonas sp.]|jgi:putative Mg2+ transporter-C (MgtC) family protein|uniref:MgtC/SapB family protein n=1 Tax=Brevundimonas sp. TaxID=1871086 RepID=UPI0039199F0E
MDTLAPLLPALALALLAGGLIGLEREWHAHPAGFRTHILVALTSALLMFAATHQGAWAMVLPETASIVIDPTRMAHGILTGIGFLCAGVIFREGFSVTGLTTAASLWITSALGILSGAGLWGLALAGLVITLITLIALKLVSIRVPTRVPVDLSVTSASADSGADARVRAALDDNGARVRLLSLEAQQGRRTTHYRLHLPRTRLHALAEALGGIETLDGYTLTPRAD